MNQLGEMPTVVEQLELHDRLRIGREFAFSDAQQGKRIGEAGVWDDHHQFPLYPSAALGVFANAGTIAELDHEISPNLNIRLVKAGLADHHVVVEVKVPASLFQMCGSTLIRRLGPWRVPQIGLDAAFKLGKRHRHLLGIEMDGAACQDTLRLRVLKLLLDTPCARKCKT